MRVRSFIAALATTIAACGGSSAPPPPPCDQACKDADAVRAMREAMKLVFNLTLQGKPVGAHDQTVACPLGGAARVFGEASSNAEQGATMVDLTYALDACAYLRKDRDPGQNYRVTLTGEAKQKGTLAVQPSATTALVITSDAMTISGTVHDPALPYDETACRLELAQSGNQVSGTICGRVVGLSL